MTHKLMHRLLPLIILVSHPVLADATAAEIVSLSAARIEEQPALLQGVQFVSADQPGIATLRLAANAGFKTIIDFRATSEDRGMDEAAEVAGLGMTYVSIPISGPDDMTLAKAEELDQLLAAVSAPALLHCSSGNRVGAMFALRAALYGASVDEAIAVGRQAGLTRSEQAVRSVLGADKK